MGTNNETVRHKTLHEVRQLMSASAGIVGDSIISLAGLTACALYKSYVDPISQLELRTDLSDKGILDSSHQPDWVNGELVNWTEKQIDYLDKSLGDFKNALFGIAESIASNPKALKRAAYATAIVTVAGAAVLSVNPFVEFIQSGYNTVIDWKTISTSLAPYTPYVIGGAIASYITNKKLSFHEASIREYITDTLKYSIGSMLIYNFLTGNDLELFLKSVDSVPNLKLIEKLESYLRVIAFTATFIVESYKERKEGEIKIVEGNILGSAAKSAGTLITEVAFDAAAASINPIYFVILYGSSFVKFLRSRYLQ